jgi:riboflavin synthase
MFTGLVEAVGRVNALRPLASGAHLDIATSLAPELAMGDSLAVNGVCLTVTGREDGAVGADLGPETLRVTTLGSLRPGDLVNLERSMRADSRFGGHFVQGHVDARGRIEAIRHDGEAHWVTISFTPALAPLLVVKGSVAVDGISLTVAVLHDDRFEVMIIPFTWEVTALASRTIGDAVNLECDMIGKYVVRALENRRG